MKLLTIALCFMVILSVTLVPGMCGLNLQGLTFNNMSISSSQKIITFWYVKFADRLSLEIVTDIIFNQWDSIINKQSTETFIGSQLVI